MAITISLWSGQEGEICRFLHSFYQKDMASEEFSRRWVGNFCSPLESVDIISALMDNRDKYNVTMYIHMDNGFLHKVTDYNYDDIIRDLFGMYYVPFQNK
jgi:hypothetical protein